MRSHQKRVTTSSCYHNPTDHTRPQYSIVSFLDSCVRVVTTSFPTVREEDPSTVIVSRTRTFVFSILARVPCRWRMLDRTRTDLNFSYAHSTGSKRSSRCLWSCTRRIHCSDTGKCGFTSSGKTRGTVRILSCQTLLS